MRLSSALGITIATGISRILGLVREQVIAALFGAGLATDAYNTAFRIPNLLRDLFAEGALSAAFVPVFTDKLRNVSKTEAFRLANLVINALLILLGAITVLIFVFARELTWVLASGFFDIAGKAELATVMARILSPFLLFVSLAAAVMGALNALGHFFLPAIAPALFNVVNIVVTLLLAPIMPRFGIQPIIALATGSMLGGIAQLGVQIPTLRREGYRYSAVASVRDPAVRKIAGMMAPAIIGLSVTQINVVIDTQIASHFGNGPVTWLVYAFRLMQLPIGLFGVSLATVNLAAVSRMLAGGETEAAAHSIATSVKTSFFLNFAASAGLIALALPIIQVIFEHGRFTHEDSEATASVLVLYVFGLSAYAAVKILVPAFYALGDPYFPLKVSATAIGLKIICNISLSYVIGFSSIALTTSLAAWVNYTLLIYRLKRKLSPFEQTRLLFPVLRSFCVSAAMGVVVWALYRYLPGGRLGMLPLRLGIVIPVGMALLFVLARASGIEEAGAIIRSIRRR
ncbi:MAG: murein biosynthesis integral membrane protein MurJ [Acidobacteriota bacterium]